jgi:probable phosphoglycerate mutase
MTTIYLVRHAQSIANVAQIYQGQTYDTDLSLAGINQAKALASHFSTLQIDRVITSPLKRALQTARAISPQPTIASEIIETNHGQWEGLPVSEIKLRWSQLYHQWTTFPAQVKFPKGESVHDVYDRITTWWDSQAFTGSTIVVSHENTIQMLLVHLLGYSLNELWKFHIPNASITSISLIQGQFSILDTANVSHLLL